MLDDIEAVHYHDNVVTQLDCADNEPSTSSNIQKLVSADLTMAIDTSRQIIPITNTMITQLQIFSRYRPDIRILYKQLILISLLILLFYLPTAESVKCYCTDDHCVPYGACDGTVCLVGILRENNQIIRTCGSHPLGCHRDEDDKWTDLCACDQPLCNTFSYLRAHTSQQRQEAQFVPDPDEVPLVFNRMDRTDDEPAPPAAPISTRTSLLTLLLVVVPLTVGGATIMVVAFNYYCHLC